MPKSSLDMLKPYLLLVPSVLIIGFLMIFPVIWNIIIALHDVTTETLLKEWPYVGAGNFINLVHDPHFSEIIWVTLCFVGGSVAGQFLLGLLLAQLLSQKVRGSGIFRVIFVIPWMLSGVVAGFSWQFIYYPKLGLINNFLKILGLPPQLWLGNPSIAIWSVVITNIWYGAAFTMLFLEAGITSISPDLYESAIVDGASAWQRFRYVTLPLLKPFIAINLILITMWTVNLFDLQWVMTKGRPGYSTTTLSLFMYKEKYFGHHSIAAATGFLMLIINLVTAYAYVKLMRR